MADPSVKKLIKTKFESREIANKFTNSLIKGTTSDHDLIELAKRLDIHLDGVLTLDETHNLRSGSYIILLNSSDTGVGHWVAMYQNEYFDSMGMPAPLELNLIEKYNRKQYQSTYAEYCGIWALLFLYAKQHHRIDLFNGFHNLDYVNIT